MSFVKIGIKINYKEAMEDYNKLLKQMGGKEVELKINPVSGKLTQKTIKDVSSATEDVTKKTENLIKTNEKAAKSQKGFTDEVKKTDGIFSNLSKTLSHNIGKMLEWSVAGTVIFGTLRKIGDGLQYVTDMDMALANIRMASNMTREETKGLAQDYLNLGKELGIAVEEIANSATELYRQGLNTQEVNSRLADYIKLSKVLGRDLQSTIELGTAATNSYGASIQKVGDIATAVGDATASSGDEIMIAIQKSASAAQTAGVSLEELSAMAATVSARTRESGAIVGNSMKSILSKLSQVNDMTGEINDDYGKTLKAMNKVGVKIEDDNGNLLDAADILTGLGDRWDDLSQKEQQYVSNTFGIYQVNRFSALLKGMTKNSKEYQDNLKVAYNSFGSTATKYEEYASTITAANERMNNEWKELYQNTINSGVVIGIVNLIGSMVDLVDQTNILGIALSVLATGAMSLLIVKFIALVPAIVTATTYLTAFGIEALTLLPIFSKLIASIGMAGVAAMGLAGITAIVVTGLSAYKAMQEQAFKATLESTSAYQKQTSQATELMQSIDDLRGKTELSNEEQIRLEGIANNLIQIYPQLKDQIDMNALSYDGLATSLVSVANEAKKANAELLKTAKAEQILRLNKATSENVNARSKTGRNSPIISDSAESVVGSTDLIIKDANDKIKALDEQLKFLDSDVGTIIKDDFKRPPKNGKPPKDYGGGNGKSSTEDLLKQFESYRQEIEKTEVSITALEAAEEMLKAQEKDYTPAIQQQIEAYRDKQDAIHSYADALREAQKNFKKGSDEWNKLESEIIDQQKAWQDNEKAIAGCIDEINDYGKKSIENLKKVAEEQKKSLETMVKMVEEYIKSGLKDQIDALKDELDAYKAIIEAKKKSIQLAEEELEYQRDLKNQQKSIAKIQDKILELKQDDSREAKAQRLALEEQLAEETEALSVTQSEHTTDIRLEALDAELAAYEAMKKAEIDALEDQLDEAGTITKRAMTMINSNITSESSTLFQGLIDWNNKYGTSIENDIVTAWQKAKDAIMAYNGQLSGADVEAVLGGLGSGQLGQQGVVAQMIANSSQWGSADSETRKRLHDENEQLGASIGATYDPSTGKWMKSGVPLYGGGTYTKTPHLAVVGDQPEFIIPEKKIMDFVGAVNTRMPEIASRSNSSMGVKFDSLLTVNGSVDSAMMPQLQHLVEKAATLASDKITESFNKRGQYRGVKAFSQ